MNKEDWLAVELGKALQIAVGKEVTVFQGMRPTELRPPCIAWWVNNSEPLDTVQRKNWEIVIRVWASPDSVDNDSARSAARSLSKKVERMLDRWKILLHNPDRFAYSMLVRSSKIVNRDADADAARGWESAYIIQTDEDLYVSNQN